MARCYITVGFCVLMNYCISRVIVLYKIDKLNKLKVRSNKYSKIVQEIVVFTGVWYELINVTG